MGLQTTDEGADLLIPLVPKTLPEVVSEEKRISPKCLQHGDVAVLKVCSPAQPHQGSTELIRTASH